MFRRPLPALLVVALALAGCGASEETTSTAAASPPDCPTSKLVDRVKVSGEMGEMPILEFEQPLSETTTSCKIIVAGKGPKAEDGSAVTFHYAFFNGRDGSEITASYGSDPAEIVLDPTLMQGVHAALNGLAAGSRVLVAITPEDGFGAEGDPESGVNGDDTILLVIDLTDVGEPEVIEPRNPLTRAEGAAVDPVEGLPTVELADDGAPAITVPDADPPVELVAQPLIDGAGDVVEAGQTITVHYTGVLWDGGEEFDSSWESGSPASFSIGTGAVIAGWDKGLVGQTIGSQVLLVIPGPDAYPDGRPGIPAGATLVFVVDILDAHA
ncbi:MAG: FKBP-type peptidyl-prolyl cis-trans isomerase [Acidimicrobiales bacterium]